MSSKKKTVTPSKDKKIEPEKKTPKNKKKPTVKENKTEKTTRIKNICCFIRMD